MTFGGPSLPEVAPVEAPPKRSDEEVERERRRAVRSNARRVGAAAQILTGPQGVTEQAPAARAAITGQRRSTTGGT